MTADALAAFVAYVRAEGTAALTRLDTLDPDELLADLRAEYEQQRRGWLDLLAMTEDDVVALHEASSLQAGRELTPNELRGLLSMQ